MMFGEWLVLILNDEGTVVAEFPRSGLAGFPAVGQNFETTDGKVYVVERVSHTDDPESRSDRQYNYPRVFVRQCGSVPIRTKRPERADSARVLPFDLPPVDTEVTSDILPTGLVAALVWCGYRAQATYYKACLRYSARLMREGAGWYVELFGYDQTKRLRLRAKQNLTKLEWLLAELSSGRLSESTDGGSCVPVASPTTAPPRLEVPPTSPRLPLGRPVLRLV
jgi:hypothetical protein